MVKDCISFAPLKFESYVKNHQDADDEADGKSGDVDECIKLLAFDIPQCDFYEVFYHRSSEPEGQFKFAPNRMQHLSPVPQQGAGSSSFENTLFELLTQVPRA